MLNVGPDKQPSNLTHRMEWFTFILRVLAEKEPLENV